jgi:vesicle-fusing ATPase
MVSTGLSLKAANLPAQDLSFTNKIYGSQGEVAQLFGGKNSGYADVKGCVFTMEGHAALQNGMIALNKVQREHAKIGLNMEVFVKPFSFPRAPSAFELGSSTIEVDLFIKPAAGDAAKEVKADELEPIFRERFANQVLTTGAPIVIDFNSTILKFMVLSCQPMNLGGGNAVVESVQQGTLGAQTELEFKQGTSGKLHVLSNKMQSRSIFTPDFNFEDLGIGGLSTEFGDIFRRAFAARVFPPHVVRDLGIKHIKGMLLFGPPGCGKTLIARKLAKFLKAAEPKIVNGPEILNKYVGASEENIRKLFEDAEKEYKAQGANSQLHIVIFDEIDAICKQRGSKGDSTGVSDSIVNQLLTKIDGVDALDNILLIGMTNRMDLVDPAMLRPGRLELHVEINLPDENGRVEILNIHTKNMREKGYLGKDVSVPLVATNTKNYSGAELEGIVRAAASYALNRKVDFKDIQKTSSQDLSEILINASDFDYALSDIKPAFGRKDDDFEGCLRHGIVPYSSEFDNVLRTCNGLIEQVKSSSNTPLLSILLEGSQGCGKTALAAHLAAQSGYPYVRRIAAETYVGWGELAKVAEIHKVFEDAYKTPLSVIVLDDLERLMDYVQIGPRFSNTILQAFFSLLKKVPPKAKSGTRDEGRILIIGTTSNKDFLKDSELFNAFNVALSIPRLCQPEHFKVVLKSLPGFTAQVVEEISMEMLGKGLGIQRLLLVAEMAVQRQSPVTKEIFLECLQCAGCD